MEVLEKDDLGTAHAKALRWQGSKQVFKEKQESQYGWSTANEKNDRSEVTDYWGTRSLKV